MNTAGQDASTSVPFEYRGWKFLCSAVRGGPAWFRAEVKCHAPSPSGAEVQLPPETHPYGTEAEAIRQAKHQAVSWVREHSEHGQGRF